MAPERAGTTPSWWRSVGAALFCADLLAVLLAGLVSDPFGAPTAPVALASAAVIATAFAGGAGLHRPRLVLSLRSDLPGIVATAVVATVALAVVGHDRSGRALGAFAGAVLLALVVLRLVVHRVTGALRRLGLLRAPVVVVGTGPLARRLAVTLLEHAEHGLDPVGFVGTSARRGSRGLPAPLLGAVDQLPRALSESGAMRVLAVRDPSLGAADDPVVDACRVSGVAVYSAPAPGEPVADIGIVRLARRPSGPLARGARWLAGAAVALVTLALVTPVAALLALLVRVETGPGVVVHEPRVDPEGHAVSVPKFRTRRSPAAAADDTLRWIGPTGPAGPVGRLLRRTGLDALPQVLAGQLARLHLPLPPIATATGAPTPELGPATRATSASSGSDDTQVDTGELVR